MQRDVTQGAVGTICYAQWLLVHSVPLRRLVCPGEEMNLLSFTPNTVLSFTIYGLVYSLLSVTLQCGYIHVFLQPNL